MSAVDPFDKEYEKVHKVRYQLSEDFLRRHLRKNIEILEMGGRSSFSHRLTLLSDINANVHQTSGDLRYASAPMIGYYDLVLCMEVFEHIHDQEADTPTEWRATGTDNALKIAWDALRPGGLLFVTTPNACSYNALWRTITMQPNFVYRPHVREYAPVELVAELKRAGFEVAEFETHDPWGGNVPPEKLRLVEAFLKSTGTVSPHRGECMFALARKPATAVSALLADVNEVMASREPEPAAAHP